MPQFGFDESMMAEFADEFSAKLTALNHLLIEAERGGAGVDAVGDLFRVAHSLKGLAALAGLETALSVTHQFESVLERVRSAELAFDAIIIEAGFNACDCLQHLLDDFLAGREAASDIAPCLELLERAASGASRTPAAIATAQAATAIAEELPASTPRDGAQPAPAREVDILRIDPMRLDQVLNVSGELMIAKARLGERHRQVKELLARLDPERIARQGASGASTPGQPVVDGLQALAEAVERMGESVAVVHRLTSSLQHGTMRLRMVPVGPLFSRFERVLRDVCRATGHEARMTIVGERTELDKTLVDQLMDPITHLLRNAVDHGLESPAERRAQGKPARGNIRLEAAHEGGQVVIRISDDGRGIDAARIRTALVERALLGAAEAEKLADRDAIAYIFHPGFSTAKQVTDISGRGVGLDIVNSRIAALTGSVEVESRVGLGSTFTIRVPLTLAMVRALLVEASDGRYALPLDSVSEIVQVTEAAVHRISGTIPHLRIRNGLLPLVDLRRGAGHAPAARCWAVLAKAKDAAIAVLVDRVMREEELVVKAIPAEMRSSNCASGATVLGDGSIALFVDLVRLVAERTGLAAEAGEPGRVA
jgi:two-component system chemotaxis sensor kinase CheA